MTTTLAVLLALCWSPARAAGTEAAADLPAQAQARYDAGDYHGAATLYGKARDQAPRSAAIQYDLGNALFKQGKTGPAIAAYQRAFDLAPRDADIRYNLDFALRRAGEELVPPGVPPLLFTVFYWLSARELAGLQWLACWTALLLASLLISRPAWRDTLAVWTGAALAFWLLAGGWWLARSGLEPARRGVIVRPAAEIRSGPGDSFSVSFTAPEGRRVEILSQSGDWLEIGVLKEGAKGWLKNDAVEKIEETPRT